MDPAMIPMPSSRIDHRPMAPVLYMNSAGLLYSVRYPRRTTVAALALVFVSLCQSHPQWYLQSAKTKHKDHRHLDFGLHLNVP